MIIRDTTYYFYVSLTQCAPGRLHGAVGLCLSCPSGSHRPHSVARTHKLSRSPNKETDGEFQVYSVYNGRRYIYVESLSCF